MRARVFLCSRKEVRVVVDERQARFLAARSFLGRDVAEAGNFNLWDNAGEFLDDPWFREKVLPELVDAAEQEIFAVEVMHHKQVGWTTVMSLDDLEDTHIELEDGTLTNGVHADFVTNLPAPLVHEVTLIGRAVERDGMLRIVLFNIRPGIETPAFPRSLGRVPAEMGLVFWGFGEPGEEPSPINDTGWDAECQFLFARSM